MNMNRPIRILFLDDDDQRHLAVDRYFEGRRDFVVDHVYLARQAIARLQERRYFLICLDHDLEKSHERLVGVPYESGQAVADYIATMPRRMLPAWVHVHSHNEAGRENMAAAILLGAPQVKVTVARFAPAMAYWDRVARFARQWSRA
jgi:CheY-like chemotaxis protein